MDIVYEIPAVEADDFAALLKEENIEYDRSTSLGSDGAQIAEFIVTYGPAAVISLKGLNELVKLYINVKKARSLKIKIEAD